MNKILIVAAHPDDEMLGMGGTILKHVNNKDAVSILFLGDGITSRDINADIEPRRRQAKKVAELLQAKIAGLEQFPDNRFDSVSLLDIVKKIEPVIARIKPNIIYTHHMGDLNIDHRLTAQSVLTACRPQPGFCVKKILGFEVLSSTEWQAKDSSHCFCPTEYTDISKFIEKKIEILKKAYGDELRQFPHPRSAQGVKILAQYRGMEVGYKYAEAFQLIRNLND